jgi:3-oxoacyl-[acyl-carrier protein] reductase
MPSEGNRVVIVTGASRGLGRTVALRFGAAGDRVVINYLNRRDMAESAAAAVRERGGEAVIYRADVRSSAEVDALISDAAGRWGRIDVLVNSAGIARDGLAVRMSGQDWDAVMDTNLSGPFRCLRSAARIMIQQRSGHIISLSSLAGLQGREGQANYSASKAGLIGLTRAAAGELGQYNIQVNAVLPGYLETDMGKAVRDDVRRQIVASNVLGRTSDPEEVAEFIYRLTLMRSVSGQVFNLDSRLLG